MPETSDIRTIELPSPSVRHEAAAVLRALGVVGVAALLLVGRQWSDSGAKGAGSTADLEAPSYQVLLRDQPAPVQRMFRQIQEGLTEAENRRPALGAWPAPEALASEGIPPFAPDPLAPGLRWSQEKVGLDTAYLGLGPGRAPSYLLLVQEPPAGTPGDPPSTPLDEVHHRLSTGVIFHVSIWAHTEGAVDATPSALARPYLGGWRQILIAPPRLSFPPSTSER